MAAPLVGRDEELAAIGEVLDGQLPTTLAIIGDAGIGKTSLWRAALDAAAERGWRTLSCAPTGSEATLSFAALGDLLDDVFEEVAADLPEPQRRALSVALLREQPGAPPDRRTVGVAVRSAIRALARDDRLLLLAIDDVQWLDAATRDVLEFALRRLTGEPLALVVARRGVAEDQDPLETALGEDRARTVAVGPLSLGALHRLLVDRLSLALPRPTLRRIVDVAQGNPFFALELGRALRRAGGTVPGAPLPVTPRLAELIHERLSALGSDARRLLPTVAALAEPTVERVAEVAGASAAAALEEAVADGVLERRRDRLVFAHPLIASVVTAELSDDERRRLHRTLAEHARDPEERARQLALAHVDPDAEVAAAIAAGAERAYDRGAPDDAAELAERARLLAPEFEVAWRLGLRAAKFSLEAGATTRARELLDELAATARTPNARAAVLAQLAIAQLYGDDWRAAAETWRELLVCAGADPWLQGEGALGLAWSGLLARANLETAHAHALQAVAAAEQSGDRAQLADALVCFAQCHTLLGRGVPERELARALALEPEIAELRGARRPSMHAALVRMLVDDFAAARALYERSARHAHDVGDEWSLAWILTRIAQLEWLSGDWDAASRALAEADEIASRQRHVPNVALVLGMQALVGAARGDEAARATAHRALKAADATGAVFARRHALWALGLLDVAAGRHRQALDALEPLASETRAGGVRDPGELRFAADAVEALVGVGRIDEAEELVGEYEATARALPRPSALVAAARGASFIAGARGDHAAAVDLLKAAAERASDLPLPFEQARTLLALGVAQRRANQRRAARETLTRARDTLAALGAQAFARAAERELASIGGRTATGELTPSEQRVAQLVAEGHTNREVAASLVVSERTVEGHLSRIYTKLGVRSRAELARRLAERV